MRDVATEQLDAGRRGRVALDPRTDVRVSADRGFGRKIGLPAAGGQTMESTPLTDADRELIDHAKACNERAFDPDFFDGGHVVAAAVRTSDGAVYDGVSLPTNVGRASICGEPVAVGAAIADGHRHDEVETCVAVSYPLPEHEAHATRVIPPCGSCRELLADYDEAMRVITPVDGENRAVRAIDLLPTRTW